MLKKVLGFESSLLRQPLVWRAPSGLPESSNEMSSGHATSLSEFIDGRRVAYSGEENFLGDPLLPRRETPSATHDSRYVRVIVD